MLAVFGGGEITVLNTPVGDGAANAMDQLAHALFALRSAHLAVEILVHHHVRGQLAPVGGDLAIGLLEQHLAALALDRGGAKLPLDRVERIGHVSGAEGLLDRQAG